MDGFTEKQLKEILNYSFNDANLLEKAFTHRSFNAENNERLEFLGDSILNFTIAESLFNKFPNLPEGDLSRLRASIVKTGSLAERSIKIKLGDFILLGEGELKSAGWRRPSILADVFEAVIGAIYLDKGLLPTKQFVQRLILTGEEISVKNKDFKSQLYLLAKKQRKKINFVTKLQLMKLPSYLQVD